MSSDSSSSSNIWGGHPSIAANVIFILLFVAATAAHLYSRIRLRAGFFNALIVGCIFEIIGYCARAAGTSNLSSVGPYAIQSLFLLLAPVLFAATCYMILGRIIYATNAEQYSILPLRWLTKTFVIADIVCFWVQAGGGSLQTITSSESLPKVGKWIVVLGLILQVIAFGFFCFVAATFHRRLRRAANYTTACAHVPWQRLMHVLYTASVLITIRNIERIAEYVEGFSGWIMTHEVMLFVFDAVPMLLLLGVLFVFHPARMLDGYMDGYKDAKKSHVNLQRMQSK